jgi:hypothetical protein
VAHNGQSDSAIWDRVAHPGCISIGFFLLSSLRLNPSEGRPPWTAFSEKALTKAASDWALRTQHWTCPTEQRFFPDQAGI